MMAYNPQFPPPTPPRSDSSLFQRPPPSSRPIPAPILPPNGTYSFPSSAVYTPYGYQYAYPPPQNPPVATAATAHVVPPPPPLPPQQSPALVGNGYHGPPVNHGSGMLKHNMHQGQSLDQRGFGIGVNKGMNMMYGEGKTGFDFVVVLLRTSVCCFWGLFLCFYRARWTLQGLRPNG